MYASFIEALLALSGNRRALPSGGYLFHQGDPVRRVFIVESGSVQLVRHQRDGMPIVVQRATQNSILAEASVYAEAYHCDAIADAPSHVFDLSQAAFVTHLRQNPDASHAWAAHLARAVQSARHRGEILARRTVTERLDGWLDWHDNELPDKGQWKGIAEQIGVSPEALYRELAKRRNNLL